MCGSRWGLITAMICPPERPENRRDHRRLRRLGPNKGSRWLSAQRRASQRARQRFDRVSLDAGTVLIDRQAIRSKGHGLRLMPTKTDAGIRTLVCRPGAVTC